MLPILVAILTPTKPLAVMSAAREKGFTGIAAWSVDGKVSRFAAGAMRASERFPACSVTKLFTAVLVVREASRGRLKLEDRAAKYLPEAADALGSATILDLLTHASGLTNLDDVGEKDADGVAKLYREDRPDSGDPRATVRRYARASGVAPGSAFAYNNLDFIALSAILERTKRLPYSEIVRREISTPLGLRSTSVLTRREKVTASEKLSAINLAVYSGAGAILTDAADLMKFASNVMSGPFLSAEERARLWESPPRFGYIGLGHFRTAIAAGGKTLAVMDRPGAIGDYAVRLELVPERRTAVVLFTRGEYDLGRVYEQRGLSFDLLAAALAPR